MSSTAKRNKRTESVVPCKNISVNNRLRGGETQNGSKMIETGKRKRKPRRQNPRRGGPGFLLTCDAGREGKCRREAQDIISYYYYYSHHSTDDSSNADDSDHVEQNTTSNLTTVSHKNVPLTLEEEISLLRKGATVDQILAQQDGTNNHLHKHEKKTLSLEPYETGCRGVVVLLLPTNNTKTLGDEKPIADSNKSITIDPISLVKRVIKDIHTNQEKESPRSRFITRMIPVQTTCFANLEEISRTAKELIDSCFPLDARHHLDQQPNSNNNKDTINNRQSFEILFKRRLCSSVTRNECIDAVAKHFDDARFKVDLTHPDYSFIMEVCKSLVCMSIVHNFKSSCHNFNLFQISEKAKGQLAIAKSSQDTTDDE